jgi:hypothetical protein
MLRQQWAARSTGTHHRRRWVTDASRARDRKKMQTCANKLEALRTPPARASASGMRHPPPRLFRTAARGHCPLALRLSQGVSIVVVVVPHPRRDLRTRCNRAAERQSKRVLTEEPGARARSSARGSWREARALCGAAVPPSRLFSRSAPPPLWRAGTGTCHRHLGRPHNVERPPPSPKQCTLALCTSNLPCNIIKSSSSA